MKSFTASMAEAAVAPWNAGSSTDLRAATAASQDASTWQVGVEGCRGEWGRNQASRGDGVE
jgi:hypothetical protein